MQTGAMPAHGRFPFGQPNDERPARAATEERPEALVVGVYPSAFHVSWSPPLDLDTRPVAKRRFPFIGSLAVDVEPTVFWDGADPAPRKLLESWKAAVGFQDSWGFVVPGNNGPSGQGLENSYLRPLGLGTNRVAMTDAIPWYFVKSSQLDAIRRLAAFNLPGVDQGELPERPTPRRLTQMATGEPRASQLRAEIVDSGAPLVITLGQEALDTIRGISTLVRGVPTRLSHDDSYGAEGTIDLEGNIFRFLPLAHPGLIRQSAKNSPWRIAHNRWSGTED